MDSMAKKEPRKIEGATFTSNFFVFSSTAFPLKIELSRSCDMNLREYILLSRSFDWRLSSSTWITRWSSFMSWPFPCFRCSEYDDHSFKRRHPKSKAWRQRICHQNIRCKIERDFGSSISEDIDTFCPHSFSHKPPVREQHFTSWCPSLVSGPSVVIDIVKKKKQLLISSDMKHDISLNGLFTVSRGVWMNVDEDEDEKMSEKKWKNPFMVVCLVVDIVVYPFYDVSFDLTFRVHLMFDVLLNKRTGSNQTQSWVVFILHESTMIFMSHIEHYNRILGMSSATSTVRIFQITVKVIL